MTDKLKDAAEMALKALKNKTTVYVRWDDGVVEATEVLEEALTQALAEPTLDQRANLIAAAPDLLEALEELFYLIDGSHDNERIFTCDIQKKCRAAIAKAKGE